jgi:hypothetical protein
VPLDKVVPAKAIPTGAESNDVPCTLALALVREALFLDGPSKEANCAGLFVLATPPLFLGVGALFFFNPLLATRGVLTFFMEKLAFFLEGGLAAVLTNLADLGEGLDGVGGTYGDRGPLFSAFFEPAK